MAINILDEETINKIAAGEVVDRPSSIVKELVENAIDAGASAITVEIKDGGISMIRITDNGKGIEKEDIRKAFYRHATSKIQSEKDLMNIGTLGFRGEALSSICAVAQVELITKTEGSLTGIRYEINGGKEEAFEEIGAPDGTTFVVRNVFYNVPARQKFLKSPTSEGGAISTLMEHLALSRPDISFRFISGSSPKLQTTGNGKLKDVIYTIYGREIAANLIEVDDTEGNISVKGFIGKPVIARSTRAMEQYYINDRFIKNNMIQKAIEEAYDNYLMLHKYPFTVFGIYIDQELLDVNVHPAKMEVRFSDAQQVYESVKTILLRALAGKQIINRVELPEAKEAPRQELPASDSAFGKNFDLIWPSTNNRAVEIFEDGNKKEPVMHEQAEDARLPEPFEQVRNEEATLKKQMFFEEEKKKYEQTELITPELLHEENLTKINVIGQIFKTYWILEYGDSVYMMDQHAAHEKILFEQFMEEFDNANVSRQTINPPIIVSLTEEQIGILNEHMDSFEEMGFEIDEFGGNEYAIRSIPSNFSSADKKELFLETLDSYVSGSTRSLQSSVRGRIATMACKAAVKGNTYISKEEAERLIKDLMKLKNPYNCPHGRPTIIEMTKYEFDRKFKRII